MPVLILKKALSTVPAGTLVTMQTDDKHAEADVRVFCEQSQNSLISQTQREDNGVVVMEHCVKKRDFDLR